MEATVWIIINILQGLCLFEGLIFGFYILSRSKRDNGDLYLGLFLISLVMGYIGGFITNNSFLNEDFLTNTRFWYWPFTLYFAQLPILFLYLRWLVKREHFDFKKHFNFFIPALLEILIFGALFISPLEIRNEVISPINYNTGMIAFMILLFLFDIYMYYITNLMLNQNRNESYLTNPILSKNIRWFRVARIYIVAFTGAFVLYFFIPPHWDPWYFLMMTILDLVFIFWIIFFSISHKSSKYLLEMEEIKDEGVINIEELVEIEKDTYSNIPEEFAVIIQNIKSKELYKNPELSVNELASKVHISSKKLSNLINQYTDGNYNTFINGFRIEEAKRMILSGKYDHLSMESISYAVGFKSIATFYRVFKLKTGYTPMDLKEKT